MSEESSLLNHIITTERPPGLSSGAIQGSVKKLLFGLPVETNDWNRPSIKTRPNADILESSICVARPTLWAVVYSKPTRCSFQTSSGDVC